jgi:PAS domain S-box-containing protein
MSLRTNGDVRAYGSSQIPINWFSADLIETLPAAVHVCDADAVVVAYNRRAAELWGREPTPGDTDQKYCGAHRLYRTDGTFLPHAETPMEAVLRTEQPARDMEVVIERPNGSRITVLVNIAPLFGDDGKLVGAVNCFQDLTVQKRAEEERRRLAAELHQAKKTEALGQLTAGVAHDFNNLLTSILGNLELLHSRTTDDRSRRLLQNAERAARRGATLNAQLLGFARKQTLLPRPVDLEDIIAGMSDLLLTTMGAVIRIETNTRGSITISTRNTTFGIGDCPEDLSPGDYVTLSISDTGIGMSEEVRAMAFDPFFTTKGDTGGSGLGLSMVLGVATQSSGGVRIASELGAGTSIEIFLPRAGLAASRANTETDLRDLIPVHDAVVLVVDDDDDVREVTAAMLASLGYSVVEAASGGAALAVLASDQRVDLLLIDIAMPGMDGIEVARLAHQQQPDLPVLFATGYLHEPLLTQGKIDPDCVVGKPYRRHELHTKLLMCWQKSGAKSASSPVQSLPSHCADDK